MELRENFLTPDKQAILDTINKIRKEAADDGLVDKYVPIKWSTDLEKTAFVRATEVSVAPETLSVFLRKKSGLLFHLVIV